MMTDSEIIAVVQAHAEGRKIQCNYKNRANIDWWNVACPNWDFSEYDFRVAPEPRKPREWLIHLPRHEVNSCGTRVDIFPGSEGHGKQPITDGECVRVREVVEGPSAKFPEMIYCHEYPHRPLI